jgi:hypothetical protein
MALFKKADPKKKTLSKSGAPILVAADITDPDGNVIATREQVVEAIKGFAKGKQLQTEGETLQETHKPILGEFARRGFSKEWAIQGVRPKSPKITTDATGNGAHITMSFIDRTVMINDAQVAELANVIGPANAEQLVEKFTQYTIDAKIASQEVEINGEKVTYQDHIEKALLSYFPEEHHEMIGAMLKPKEIQQIKKGALDRLLDMVGRGKQTTAALLAEAIQKARIVVAYKAGAVAEDDEE